MFAFLGACQPSPQQADFVINHTSTTSGQASGAGEETKSLDATKNSLNSCLYITNGIAGDAASFPALVLVRSDTGYCTGTFVGPHAVLTAAHCLSDSQTNGGGPLANLTISVNNERIPVSTVYFPQWAGDDNATIRDDLAVLVVPAVTAPAFMPVGTAALKVGDAVTMVGYGSWLDDDDSSSDNPNVELYSGANTILAFVDKSILAVGESGYKNTSPKGHDSLTGPGDSGGPLIHGNSIIGVDNWGTPTLTDTLFDSYHGQISAVPSFDTQQSDELAMLGQIPDLAQIKQEVEAGRSLSIDSHADLTNPTYQTWLKNLTRQGIDIRFAAAQECR